MKYILQFFYLVLQFTWGAIQNALGFLLFLKNIRCEHAYYHGAILTFHEGDWGGVSLGAFIFINGKRGDEYKKTVSVHEYGHTIQSLILGPLYLFVVGIPSFVWCNNKKCIAMRQDNNKSYYDLYCENWANRLGEAVTHEEAPHK